MVAGNSIFEGVLKFSASEARKNFDITDSEFQVEEDHYEYTSTQEYQKLEGKLKHDSTGENRGVIGVSFLWLFS